MAKKTIVAKVRLHIKAGEATAGPPIAPALGPHGVNIMEFVKSYNAKTEPMKGKGFVMPVHLKVFSDRSFEYEVGQPTMTSLIKIAAVLKSGSATPGKGAKAAMLSKEQVLEIAHAKMPDLTACNLAAAVRTVVGSASSMGIGIDFKIEELVE